MGKADGTSGGGNIMDPEDVCPLHGAVGRNQGSGAVAVIDRKA